MKEENTGERGDDRGEGREHHGVRNRAEPHGDQHCDALQGGDRTEEDGKQKRKKRRLHHIPDDGEANACHKEAESGIIALRNDGGTGFFRIIFFRNCAEGGGEERNSQKRIIFHRFLQK